jgi:hypothetical protein
MSLILIKRIVLILAATQLSFTAMAINSSAPFSTQLPTGLLNKWTQLIGPEIDNPDSPMIHPLVVFRSSLAAGKDANAAAEALLSINFEPGKLDPIQARSYFLRVDYLRYLIENPNEAQNESISSSFLQSVKTLWQKKYIEGTLSSVNVVLPQYKKISENFLNLWKQNLVKVVDLSPSQRFSFHNLLGKSHGVSLTDETTLSNGTQSYRVNGFYYDGSSANHDKFLAVDFSLPPGETLITVTHEVVHAADPTLVSARSELQALSSQIFSIFKKLFPGTNQRSETITKAILDQVFLELGHEELIMNNFKKIEELTLQKINNSAEGAAHTINENDVMILKQWAKLIITLTLENEYKAYGYSIVAYSQFKMFNMINISDQRDRFLSSLSHGDKSLAEDLANYMNPFSRNASNKYFQIASSLQNVHLSENEKLTLDRSINYLESIYTQEVHSFVSGVGSYFQNLIPSDKLQNISSTSGSGNSPMPELNSDWTSAGQLNSPLNPYSIITAKLSSYWIVRLKQQMHLIVDQLIKIKSVLLSLRSGVYDFSNLSADELKYLGLISPNSEVPNNCGNDVNYLRPLNPAISNYSKFLPLQHWSSDSVNSTQALQASKTVELLIAMELFHGLSWLDSDFSNLKTNSMASRVLIEKLNNKSDGYNDLSQIRVKELLGEIREGLEYVGKNASLNLNEINVLYDFVIAGQNITNEAGQNKSFERDWRPAQQLFNSKRKDVNSILELMGFEPQNFNAEDSMARWRDSEDEFKESVKSQISSQCEAKGFGGLFNGSIPMQFHSETMKINYACNKSQPYLFHMPCNLERSERSLQVTITDGVLIGLSSDGRLIELPEWKPMTGDDQ